MRTNGWLRSATAAVLLTGTLTGCGAQAATDDSTDAPDLTVEAPDTGSTPTIEPVAVDDGTGGGDAADDVVAPSAEDPGDPSPEAQPEEDGTWPALIVEVRPDVLVLDRIEILAGDEAAAAMTEDGMAVEEGVDVPYLRNRNPRLRELPVGEVTVEVYDCDAGCALVPWSYDKLTEGTPLPYGHSATAWSVTVSGGEVTRLVEVYLP